ncbi:MULTISPECIES: S-layer homology domain-containing protein [Paenibacillus]|uniref:S-layer homology domain-containing protein n=2 Tax=Paenibacillus TaxID=44249 RepID=A0A7Y6BTI9_9BACL|nr:MULTISPECIES: S-layer homology domain-containing protein [Paenibacillus]MDN4603989.1 S-layer homology domain-containing protein [Paenibacillus vandeheii]NUU74685.1 S-layer homology domain-containing protein [Paenibacillus xylanilyticus]
MKPKFKSKMYKKMIVGLTVLTVVATSFATELKFSDVPSNYWAKDTIAWGVDQNIIQGYQDNTFKPDQNVTEAEFITMFINAFEGVQETTNTYWASGYYEFAKKHNWAVNGYNDKKAASTKINRTRVAEIVTGAVGVNYSGEDAIRYMLTQGLAEGRGSTPSVSGFQGSSLLKRSEAVQFIKNLIDKGVTDVKDRPTTPSDPSDIPALPGDETPASGEVILKELKKADASPDVARAIGYMPQDKASEKYVKEFLNNVNFKGGSVTVVVPKNIPSGYKVSLSGVDGTAYSHKVTGGETFTFKVDDAFSISMFVGTTAKQSTTISSKGEVIWGAKHS